MGSRRAAGAKRRTVVQVSRSRTRETAHSCLRASAPRKGRAPDLSLLSAESAPSDFVDEVRSVFEGRFGRAPEWGARAPGRVNLIGEHTDYGGGLVMPCAIDRDTVCFGAPRGDRRLRVFARDLDETAEFDLDAPTRQDGFVDYVQAVVWSLAESGHDVPGLDLVVSSRVPPESGLSSSAALGLAVIGVLQQAAGLGLDLETQARIVHRGECDFVGVGCGLLDQFASALGRRDHALRIDCQTGAWRAVPMPPGELAILLVHSEVERALAGGAYRQRVDECAAAVAGARAAGIGGAGLEALSDLSVEHLPALERVLDPVPFRRARHVLTENARVDAFVAALEAGDLGALGPILHAGQASLRDDYEVSVPQLDALCTWGEATEGVIGARLTGAGFGGCALLLVRPAATQSVAAAMQARFAERFGRTPRVFAVHVGDGAAPIV